MTHDELVEFHREAMRGYWLICFPEGAAREIGRRPAEAAYHLLEHAGMVYRYTADQVSLEKLRAMARDDRRQLVLASCNFILRGDLPQRTVGLLARYDENSGDTIRNY